MKRMMLYLAVSTVTLLMVMGCAKQPTDELNAAKTAVDAVISEGAQKYAPEDAKKLNDTLQAAQDEIKAQDGKWFKNFDKAKEVLAKAKADADTLKTGLAAKKEEAKKNALAAQDASKAAVDEAKALLAKAPKGKGSKADLEAFKADLKGIEDSLTEVKSAVDSEDYSVAVEKANAAKEKAAAISDQIKKAMEKVGKKK